jgi:branched-chain amino acid transport system ATP-binding protein
MMAIGRVLMTNSRFMILDEGTEGLALKIRDEIWHVLEHNLKQSDQAILVIDKHPETMARPADRHYTMDKGLLVWEGDPESPMNSSHMMEQYLGV